MPIVSKFLEYGAMMYANIISDLILVPFTLN
jgi:hypothetical protein